MRLAQFISKPVNTDCRYYYISGDAYRAVELVLSVIADAQKVTGANRAVFFAGIDSVSDFMDSLTLVAYTPRIVILRNAEKFKRWDLVFKWVRHPIMTTLIVVADEPDSRKSLHPEIFRWFAEYGSFIECRNLKSDITLVLTSYLGIDSLLASRLQELVGNDVDRLLAEVMKIKAAGFTRPEQVIQSVVRNPIDSVIDGLFSGIPRLPDLYDSQILAALGLVELELIRQAGIMGLMRLNIPYHEMAQRLSIPIFAIGDIAARARQSNPTKLFERLHLVLRTQELYNVGARDGLMLWFLKQWR